LVLVTCLAPVDGSCERRLAIGSGAKILESGKGYGKVGGGERVNSSVAGVYDGKGLTPIALAAEQPVSELVLDLGFPQVVFFQPPNHRRLGFVDL
jgi:hypothetical protein